jgi:hypothetical protein
MTEFAKSMTRRVAHGSFDEQFEAWKRTKDVIK